MIEKIFIPTVNRSDNQITYNNLPDKLKKNVVMVVQDWEKDKYDYPCEILVLPKEINLKDEPYCFAKTKQFIYEQGKNIKYAVLDDDLIFKRRNSKYWNGISNMEKSKRVSTEEDIIEMFDLFDSWLDDKSVTVCGCGHSENPPGGKSYATNTSLSSCFWINGTHFADELSSYKLSDVRVAEDVVFLLTLLTNGYGNRVSQEFIFFNNSVHKKMKSAIWDVQTVEQTLIDHKKIEKMFPGIFTILYEDGKRMEGGFRNHGKSRIQWSKAFKPKVSFFE